MAARDELDGQAIRDLLDTCAGDWVTYQDRFDEIDDAHQMAGEPEYMEISARSARIQGQARVALEALSGGPIVVDRPDPVGNLKKKEGSIQIVIDTDLRQVENSYLKEDNMGKGLVKDSAKTQP